VIKRKTARGRFIRALKRIAEWCKLHRPRRAGAAPIRLCQAVRGHYGYFGITGNSRAITHFTYGVVLLWLK
jgi:hypothetical protein